MKHLVLGGVKSGKSKFAETTAELLHSERSYSAITLVATAQALDDEMSQRIRRHKDERSSSWRVVEEPLYLSRILCKQSRVNEVLVIDCLTLWITNLLMLEDEQMLDKEISSFIESVDKFEGTLILVSNETNMGIMPLGELSRRYCDLAGNLHKSLATLCDKVDLIVAGLSLPLKPSNQCHCSTYSGGSNRANNHE